MFFVLVHLLSVILEPSWVQVGPSWGQDGLSIDPEGSQRRFGWDPDLHDDENDDGDEEMTMTMTTVMR